MNKNAKKALWITIAIVILFPLVLYLASTNEVMAIIFGIIFGIIIFALVGIFIFAIVYLMLNDR